MSTKQEFARLMDTQTKLALAIRTDDQPNVRTVNFYFDEAAKAVFFSTFADNEKVKEFERNNRAAFTTIPHQGNKHVKVEGLVRKGSRTILDVAEHFIKKIPDYKDTLEQIGEHLILFEVTSDTAIVTLDFENIETYHLADNT